jgi:hypothetical protein
VQLAKNMVENRQSKEYVAQLDQQLLQSMTPDQLKALANRALERNQQYQRNYDDRPAKSTVSDPLETAVTATATTDALPGLRATIEAVLSRDAKGWRFDAETPTSDGRISVRYVVRCRKKRPAPRLQDALRRALVALTDDVTVQ